MTKDEAVKIKAVYELRIKHFIATMNKENQTFNNAMIDMNRRCLEIINERLAMED